MVIDSGLSVFAKIMPENHPANCGHNYDQYNIGDSLFSSQYASDYQHIREAERRTGEQKSKCRPVTHARIDKSL